MDKIKESQYDLTMIIRDEEGAYRWTYEVDSRTNRSFLNLYLLIFGLIILIPGAILFLMIYGRQISTGYWNGTGGYLGIWLLVFLGVELLTFLIYKGIEKMKGGVTDISYLMTDTFIKVHPDDQDTPEPYLRTDFSAVKDIRYEPGSDLILLYEPLRVTHVYVWKDDISFVLNYILDRIPRSDKTEALRKTVKR